LKGNPSCCGLNPPVRSTVFFDDHHMFVGYSSVIVSVMLCASHATLMGKTRNACAIFEMNMTLFNKLKHSWKYDMKPVIETDVSNV
jgi:hypothetical protein